MAMSSVYVTAPAAAAAMGLYFFGKNISNNQEVGVDGGAGAPAGAKEKKEGIAAAPPPKLAPQFDGLYCFETIAICAKNDPSPFAKLGFPSKFLL